MPDIRFGIVGSGMIAGVTAKAIDQATGARAVAVSSKHFDRAKKFASEHKIAKVFKSWQQLVEARDIDAVYVATPTIGREEICLAALENGNHLISEKPFLNGLSARRIANQAQSRGLAFMDATHFTHHPRTKQVIKQQQKSIGDVQRIYSAFLFPFVERDNIRFNPKLEPTGAIADIGWYNMRAIVEFLRPAGTIQSIAGAVKRDQETGAVISGTGMIEFSSAQTSTFDFGYDAGVCDMDLNILGDNGLIQLNDFVLDWKDSFVFGNPNYSADFTLRQGMATPREFEHFAVDTQKSQVVYMIEHFCHMATTEDIELRNAAAARAIHTQELLDHYCSSVGVTLETSNF
ncbi:Gfo/Idh/MocA family protein [Microbulbifer variabilis]|uniref:Gfo/Idh/MocA family protein n=1 Tax=Microbulbifer variabilis TaxID=266805 RepID=UPI00035C1626|nr:Gfo/Idh/MocA family oxidoreductase [Microbulbifer variabilis]